MMSFQVEILTKTSLRYLLKSTRSKLFESLQSIQVLKSPYYPFEKRLMPQLDVVHVNGCV